MALGLKVCENTKKTFKHNFCFACRPAGRIVEIWWLAGGGPEEFVRDFMCNFCLVDYEYNVKTGFLLLEGDFRVRGYGVECSGFVDRWPSSSIVIRLSLIDRGVCFSHSDALEAGEQGTVSTLAGPWARMRPDR